MTEDLPLPLDNGARPQAVVEYLGPMTGNFSHVGHVSHRTYRFAQTPRDRWVWVLSEDLELYRSHPDYRVHDELAIDPERDALRALEQKIDALRQSLTEAIPPEVSTPVRRGGRPPIPESTVMEAWHIRNHCGWSWRDVALHQGIGRARPDAAIERRVARWLKQHPERKGEQSCALCDAVGCPPAVD